ncbi:GntR family transcriptional regulator [Octadecabacter sp. CECT 8868]|uniref:GntR family transcriptional regulator n=1 Tax=Octadecabacter algicola TaxID=2909342 RepID=UPI001F23484A|nr:GntR family transcriptional regulator [Octadecabacter algicola]MCF2904219.1 GntR family transcriptional regulator [Octadecabacter algicola]
MSNSTQTRDRRTSVDEVFDYLRAEISESRLLPGDKISESEIAAKFGISRQPVRDAFSRLENLDLLLIRPQRSTEVKRFSMREITKSRFVRSSVEAEVLRLAAANCDALGAARLKASLELQAAIVEIGDYDKFGEMDYEFHQILCDIGHVDFAFEVIKQEKANVDRLCQLGLAQENRMPQLLDDHREIAKAVQEHDAEGAVEAGMKHLHRLDATIDAVSDAHADYFDP